MEIGNRINYEGVNIFHCFLLFFRRSE